MYNKYEDEILRMEKKATNKTGIVILVIVLIILLGVGGLFLYKNRDNIDLDFSLPWQKEKNENKDNNDDKDGEKKNNATQSSKLNVPQISNDIIRTENTYVLSITNVTADDKGYLFNFKLEATEDATSVVSYRCDKILIDGYDTTASFYLSATYGTPATTTARINRTELDQVGITDFNELTLFSVANDGESEEEYIDEVSMIQPITVDNEKKGLIKLDKKNEVEIDFYKMEDDNEYNYLYFLANNEHETKNHQLRVKRLIINDKLYEYNDLYTSVHYSSKKVFSIKIPKSDYKEINKIKVSFFLICDELEEDDSIYITNEQGVDIE